VYVVGIEFKPVLTSHNHLHHEMPDISFQLRSYRCILHLFPSMVAHTTYANALIPKGHGYPLWEPDPGECAPVELADVGYMADGGFIKLFNASAGTEDRSNRLGLPQGYSPLLVGEIQRKTPLAKRPKNIKSEGVSEISANLGVTAGYVTFPHSLFHSIA
jgi:hypothetical protein